MNPQYAYVSSEQASGEAADRRMADLATFADGLIHDIRNPLNVIKANAYLLRQRLTGGDEKVQRALTRLDDQIGAGEQLLEDTQALFRSERPPSQQVQLNDVVARVMRKIPLPEGYELRLELDRDLPPVPGDPHLLEPALRALVRNAVEAMDGPDTIRIATGRHEDRVRLIVEDRGAGISQEALSRVFEPLFTTRRAHGGLGLVLVAKAARAHGGRALIGSSAGIGTQAVLELPVSASASTG